MAQRIKHLIQSGGYEAGARLPSIAEMARRFGVGSPTVREALRKLQTVGVVTIRHGSGVYVNKDHNSLVLSNPVFDAAVSKKLLLDLIDARIPIEMTSAGLAAQYATASDLAEMARLLTEAHAHLDDDAILTPTNLAFHRQIAVASNNSVLLQILEVLSSVFQKEQRLILDIYGSREHDHAEHVGIYEAVKARNKALAVARMKAHLEGVRETLVRWNPTANPVA